MKKEKPVLAPEHPDAVGHAPTSLDVALLAGVSQSSVCRVFDSKWSDRISPRLRARVLSAADELGYRPNAIARSLTGNPSRIIGIVVSEEFNQFYYKLLCSLTNELQSLDMQVMLFNAAPYQDIQQVFQKMNAYQVDGVIVTAAAISNVAEPFDVERHVPMVLVNIYSTEPFCDTVVTDNYHGSEEMAAYLYHCGCRKFGFISAEKSRYFDVPDRKRGFLDFLAGKEDASCQCLAGDYSYGSGQELGRQLLGQEDRPDCIFCTGSNMAYGVMDVAHEEFGLSIPEDLSVAGYDDLFGPALGANRLTAVQQDLEKLAKTSVRMLLNKIHHGSSGEVEILQIPTRLTICDSVRSPEMP